MRTQKPWDSESESQTYDADYYANHTKYYERGIPSFEQFIRENIEFDSMCELGCGTGAFSAPFVGDKDVVGIDFSVGSCEVSFLPKENFRVGDLSQPLSLDRKYDLVLSLEVWEHLKPEVEAAYLNNVFALSPKYAILSCALPGQVGRHHYTPHTHHEAVRLVNQRGYVVEEQLTEKFRKIKRLEQFYRKNTFVYVQGPKTEPMCITCGGLSVLSKTYCSEKCHTEAARLNESPAPFKKTVGQYMLKRHGMW